MLGFLRRFLFFMEYFPKFLTKLQFNDTMEQSKNEEIVPLRNRYRYYKTVIIVGPKYIKPLHDAMLLSYGPQRVVCSMHPKDIFGLLKQMRPKLLIIEPELFDLEGISAADINAYRNDMRYHIVTVYDTKSSLRVKEKYKALRPDLEYVAPKEFLTMTYDIPIHCRRVYVKVKEPLEKFTRENIHNIFVKCGFHCHIKGAAFMEEALYRMYFDPDLHLYGRTSKLYRQFAEEYGTTPRIVERSMQRFMDYSMKPAAEKQLKKELDIPDFRTFDPLNFRNFTLTFNTYYTLKFGFPEKILKKKS